MLPKVLLRTLRAKVRRRAAQDFTRFKSDIESPFDASLNPYVMPANGRIAVSHSVGVAAGELQISWGDRTFVTPALAADAIYKLDYVPRGASLSLAGDIAGDVSLYILDEWNRPYPIATATLGA